MADLPNTPVAVVPAESPGDPVFPSLTSITVADLVGPLAANRQHNQQKTRTATLRDRVNKIIADLTFIETGGPGTLNAFLPRDGGQAMGAALNFGGFKGVNAADPTAAQDVATKAYADAAASAVLAFGYHGDIKIVALTSILMDVETADVLDGTGVRLISIRNKSVDVTVLSAAGGRDYGGPLLNVWHYIYAIAGTNPDNVIASTDPGPGYGGSGPSLPAGYTFFRLIGCFLVQSGSVLPFRYINGIFLFDDVSLTVASSGANPGTSYTTLGLSPYVPTIAERAIIGLRHTAGGAQNLALEFRSRGGATITGQTARFADGSSGSAGVGSDAEISLHVDASQFIDWRTSLGTPGGHTVEVHVRGFVPDLKFD